MQAYARSPTARTGASGGRSRAAGPPTTRSTPLALGHGDEFLGAVDPHRDHHQEAHFRLVEADVDVDSVGPHLQVVHSGPPTFTRRVIDALVVYLRRMHLDRTG